MRAEIATGVLVLALLAGVPAAAKSTPPRSGSTCAAAQVGHTVKGAGGVTLTCRTSPNGKYRQWVAVGARGGGGNSGGGNGGSSAGSGGGSPGDPNASPMLENFQIRIGPFDPATGKAGDLVFSKDVLQPQIGLNTVFDEFGHKVSGQQTKDLPHFTFYAPLGTQVLSPINGVVVALDDKAGSQDQSLTIVPNQASNWGVNLDHLIAPTVQRGSAVSAGQVVGTVGVPIGTVSGWGANEMTVFHFTSSDHNGDANKLFVCPWEGWDPAKRSSAQAAVTALMAAWESWYGDPTVYDEAHQVSPGCDFESEPAH